MADKLLPGESTSPVTREEAAAPEVQTGSWWSMKIDGKDYLACVTQLGTNFARFDDPRTRVNYLKWAPYLLEAEEYHAGNRGIRPFYSPFECVSRSVSFSSFTPKGKTDEEVDT